MKVRKPLAIGALVVVLIGTSAGNCDSVSPCQVKGQKTHGGAPRANSKECKEMQQRASELEASKAAASSRIAASKKAR